MNVEIKGTRLRSFNFWEYINRIVLQFSSYLLGNSLQKQTSVDFHSSAPVPDKLTHKRKQK